MVLLFVPFEAFLVTAYVAQCVGCAARTRGDVKSHTFAFSDLNVVCGAPMYGKYGARFQNVLSTLVKEEDPLTITTAEVAKNLTGESLHVMDMPGRSHSVPDQPLMVAISATALVMQWSVSIASNAQFLVELYSDADLIESHLLSPSMRQYTFQDLRPFTMYSADLTVCTDAKCGAPSAMAFAATWPGTPSAPLRVEARPRTYNSLEVTWNPPASPNGQIEGYVAVTAQPYRECYSDNLQYRRCYINDLPANITVEVYVVACNLPNAQGQGGGCGSPSNMTVAKMWNGGLDEELMVVLAANSFTGVGTEAESTKSISLYLPLSLISVSGTGPLNNISLVVQLAHYYEGPESPLLLLYDSYPYDDGVFHKHPILGTYRSHEVHEGWEVLVTGNEDNMHMESLCDSLFLLGDGTGFPRSSHYFNGPLQSNTEYALRLYSPLGYATTRPVVIQTADVPVYTSMMVGIPIGVVVLFTVVFTLYKRLQMKWIQSQIPMESGEYRYVKFSISYIYPKELQQTRIISPLDLEDFNAYVFCLLSGPDHNLNIQYRPWPLIQLHFTGWPRHGVPRVDIFYNFVVKCLKYLDNFAVGSDYGPPTVHSRPDDGRAGTLVCAAVLLSRLRSNSQKVDVFGTVLALSKFRPGIITSKYCIDFENLLPGSEDEDE
ncbi:Tyrosine-protein phosphatase Lar [Echinococcus granulosus]|uniref:Tyrosine-protein phosphatase Lar n=1 Tax=Echinococcus granulosus TaxID=6210 RepID=W6UD49_ECHGR|nr:Tyrosine-protein phosphatase Lar [Echinococcus granulosus]EUB56247.1 Tyrosine-protein phosphatase Lar [Echinococcus granulosus]